MSNTQKVMSLFVQMIHFHRKAQENTVLSHQEQKKKLTNTQPREGV